MASSLSAEMGRCAHVEEQLQALRLELVAIQEDRAETHPSAELEVARDKNATLKRHLQQLAAVLMSKQRRQQFGDGPGGAMAATQRPQFGGRVLRDEEEVYTENAWDNVEWSEEQLTAARAAVDNQAQHPVGEDELGAVVDAGGEFWDVFYRKHENRFFKDRHWLLTEFSELKMAGAGSEEGTVHKDIAPHFPGFDTPRWMCSSRATRRVLEVGCGAGNTIFPLLDADADPGLFVYGCDFAASAVDVVRSHVLYDPNRCHVFVCDVSTEDVDLPPSSLDVIMLIFVLSAINPDRIRKTLQRLATLLKPGGLILLRDYGRYDLAQLRFKHQRYLADNFYIRGDRTKVYFFSQEEMREHMRAVGLQELQNRFDNRLIVNRAKREQMFRVWLQCKYQKPTT